jgi:transketolase
MHTHKNSPKVSLEQMANAIRFLSADAVEKARSGHPGLPLGMADVATVLFSEFLKYSPKNPEWADRDRFVLSAGHGSMLLYSLLYLTGYEDMTLEDLKNFRQLHSKTAGHPEYGEAKGIETTTGPLGQGFATAVGMALAEKNLSARFGSSLVDHHTYVVVGDGCLMEGISQEAISFAGHMKLSKLIVLFDDNQITIDGPTSLSTSDNHKKRFEACGWDVFKADGHDFNAIREALALAKTSPNPAMIAFRTTIGFGAPTKAGSSDCHGSPLGAEEIKGLRTALKWPYDPFVIPKEILEAWRMTPHQGEALFEIWDKRVRELPEPLTRSFFTQQKKDLEPQWENSLKDFCQKTLETKPKMATRKSSQHVLDFLTPHLPQLMGGSADLTGSNNTKAITMRTVTPEDPSGNYIYYGIREHAMTAMMSGLSLHGGFIPYGGTFLTFSDYCKPSIRLAALMKQRSIFVMTHDSIGLGEDGPTHQPIEHLMSMRATPNLQVFRPMDTIETAEAWDIALRTTDAPSMIVLSRQDLPTLRKDIDMNHTAHGGYILSDSLDPKVTILATGSEVSIAMDVMDLLKTYKIACKVVSLPCFELFDKQSKEYRQKVLSGELLVSIEAGTTFGWEKYVGLEGLRFGIDTFGASAPAVALYEYFGLTPEIITEKILMRLKNDA